jgi:hypothetical protein
MNKKHTLLFLMLPLVLILAACASLKLPGTSSSTETSPQTGQNQLPNMANQPIEQKLALGTLKLEGTDQAVSADEAKMLLPLWKAVKALSSSSNTSTEETKALYQQIQEAMTAEQVQAIKDLSITPADLQGIMQKYAIQAPQMRFGNQNGTPIARGTPGTRTRSGNGGTSAGGPAGGGPGGFSAGGDMGGPPNGGFPGGAGQPNAQGTPRVRGTPGAGFANRGGMNNMFIDPLIKVLQERAGIQSTPTAQ